jgi:hypothetical protein
MATPRTKKGPFHHQQGLVPTMNGAAKQGSRPVHAGYDDVPCGAGGPTSAAM